MKVLPLLKTHYSLCRSTFTAEKPKGNLSYPISVIDLAINHKLETLVIVDNSISGILELSKNCAANKIKLFYGLIINICRDIEEKTEESIKTEAKYIIFLKNNEGYKDLIKITSKCNTDGFYYHGRIDFKTLKTFWNEDNLSLAVPFYDSFLHRNTLQSYLHVPDFSFTKPTFLAETNQLPFDDLITARVNEYSLANNCEVVAAQSIYYYSPEDFTSYQTLKCLGNRSNLDKPELDHCSSNTFNFLRWAENSL